VTYAKSDTPSPDAFHFFGAECVRGFRPDGDRIIQEENDLNISRQNAPRKIIQAIRS
jgi:hypothetical protein